MFDAEDKVVDSLDGIEGRLAESNAVDTGSGDIELRRLIRTSRLRAAQSTQGDAEDELEDMHHGDTLPHLEDDMSSLRKDGIPGWRHMRRHGSQH